MQIVLANPRGFCAGVDRAIEIVEQAIEAFGSPIYVHREVVHNRTVVDSLKEKGAIFIDDLTDVPVGSYLIFSAHGVSKQVQKEAKERNLTVFDATCPLVTKVHLQVAKHAKSDREVILIGHAGHPEVEGTMGQYEKCTENGGIYLVETPEDVKNLTVNNPDNLAYVTQTTLSMTDTKIMIDALRARFTAIQEQKKDDICYATQNRQDAVYEMAKTADMILVVGPQNSSSSNRLREIAEQLGKPAYLIETAKDMQPAWFEGMGVVGVTAGASAPEVLVEEVISQLKQWGGQSTVEIQGIEEKVMFIGNKTTHDSLGLLKNRFNPKIFDLCLTPAKAGFQAWELHGKDGEQLKKALQDEISMQFQEACIPELAEGAVKQAYYHTLAAGCKVIEVVNGQLVESSPDGSYRILKNLPKAIPVKPDQRVLRLKK